MLPEYSTKSLIAKSTELTDALKNHAQENTELFLENGLTPKEIYDVLKKMNNNPLLKDFPKLIPLAISSYLGYVTGIPSRDLLNSEECFVILYFSILGNQDALINKLTSDPYNLSFNTTEDTFGWTLLHYAAQARDTDLVETLTKPPYNLDIHAKSNSGITPLDLINPIEHADLVGLVKSLYKKANYEGICHGFALMSMQAILSGNFDEFETRLNKLELLLKEYPGEKNYTEIIQRIRADNDTDLLAFFEGLELCMEIHAYPELFREETAPKNQASINSVQTALSLIASSKLEKKGDIMNMGNFSGAYSGKELISYFDSFKQTIESNSESAEKPTTNIVLTLSSQNHTITVGYNPIEKEWIFTDANQISKRKAGDSTEIAKLVQVALLIDDREFCPISTQIYIAGKQDSSEVKSWETTLTRWHQSESFQQIHTLNPDKNTPWLKSAIITRENASKIQPLLAEDSNNLIKDLINQGANINVTDNNGVTPLMNAVLSGNADIIKILIDKGADVYAKDNYEFTALMHAYHLKNTEAIRIILQAKITQAFHRTKKFFNF